MFSTVLIIPAALQTEANTLGEAMGWGPNNYSVPLSADGSEPATHFGLHAWVEQTFVDLLGGVAQGQIPPVEGLTPAQVVEVVSALIVSIRPDSGGHWVEVLADNSLQRVVVEEMTS
jgi:hypothetical protein